MALKKTSKELLAEAIKELMQQRSLKDITVQDILELSGVSRATFYKHFYDKQQLAEYVFIQELSRMYFFDFDRSIVDRETDILEHVRRHRGFYQNALKSDEFVRAWMRQAYQADLEYLTAKFGDRVASQDDLALYARFCSRTLADATMAWIRDPDAEGPAASSAAELARKLTVFCEYGVTGLVEERELHI